MFVGDPANSQLNISARMIEHELSVMVSLKNIRAARSLGPENTTTTFHSDNLFTDSTTDDTVDNEISLIVLYTVIPIIVLLICLLVACYARNRKRRTGLALPMEEGCELLTVSRGAIKLMRLEFQETYNTSKTNTHDVIIFYHDDDLDWIEDHLIPFLSDSLQMSVSNKLDFCSGSISVEKLIREIISSSEYVILVLSDSFVEDPECQNVTTRAYASSPHKVIPLGLRLTCNLRLDSLVWRFIRTNRLEWSDDVEKQVIFRNQLIERLFSSEDGEDKIGIRSPSLMSPCGASIESGGRIPVLKLMRLVFQETNSTNKTKTHDVFIHYHDDDLSWIEKHLIPFLSASLQMSVSSKEDFCPGSISVKELIQCISLWEFVILVLSDSFVKDPECRYVTTIAYSSSPHKVIPLGLRLARNLLKSDPLFWSLVQTNGFIEWSDKIKKQEIFWDQLRKQLSINDKSETTEEEHIQIVRECLLTKGSLHPHNLEVYKTQPHGRTTEVFLHYHDDDSLWIKNSLIPYLENIFKMSVTTREDIMPGSITLEGILKNIQFRDMLIFVISNSFLGDQECRETITRSFTLRPGEIVQIILSLTEHEVGSDMHKLILSMVRPDNRIHVDDPTEDSFTNLKICLDRVLAEKEQSGRPKSKRMIYARSEISKSNLKC